MQQIWLSGVVHVQRRRDTKILSEQSLALGRETSRKGRKAIIDHHWYGVKKYYGVGIEQRAPRVGCAHW